jgi:hypothetical protein
MIGFVLVAFLQVSATDAVPIAADQVAIPAGEMDCDYDRTARVRNCTTSDGEQLRCRRERTLGSRFYTWVCFTHREDQQIQDQTREQMYRQQRITTPDLQ